jgi:hypothetical protein
MSLCAILPIGGAGFAPLIGAVAKRHIAYQAVLRHYSTVKQAFPQATSQTRAAVIGNCCLFLKKGRFQR